MLDLTQTELQNLRNLINTKETYYQKLINYAEFAVDPQIKQIFLKEAQDTLNAKQKLISIFNS